MPKALPYVATGTSMSPFLRPGDKVYLQKIPFGKVVVNDIILVRKNREFFIHRVVFRKKAFLVTKGDNNLISDGVINKSQFLGKVIKIKRKDLVVGLDDLYLIQSNHYLKEIVKVKRLLDKNHIKYVFLKGLPVHLYFEGKYPRRLYFDCDILIDKNYTLIVQKIFLSLRYKKLDTSLSKKIKKDQGPEVSYRKIYNGFPITFDVHYEPVFMMTQLGHLEALYPRSLLDRMTNEMIETRKKIKIANEVFFILDMEYLILYLALHFFHHNFKGAFRLELLHNIITALSHHGTKKLFVDLAQKIKEYRLENFVAPTFFLLKKYYGTPLPSNITKKVANVNIFDTDPRVAAGVLRFKTLFMLSPNPFWRKLLVFLNPQVIAYVAFALGRKLSYWRGVLLKNR